MANNNLTAMLTEQKNGTTLKQGNKAANLQLEKAPKNGDAQLPVQNPGGNAQTMTAFTLSDTMRDTLGAPPATNDETPPAAENTYISQNEQIWGENGSGQEGYEQQVESQQQTRAATPFTEEELRQLMIAAGIDPSLLYEYSHRGGYTQNKDTAIAGGGTGQPVNFYRDGTWYYYDGKPREVKAGTAGADEDFLSDGVLQLVRYCQEMYAKAATPEEKTYWHDVAEKLRAGSGYSGGADGSMHIPIAKPEAEQDVLSQNSGLIGTGGISSTGGTANTPEARMQGLLDAWKAAAEEQANASVDYAVQQAIKEYERALKDAQPQFKEQAESVSWEERQAMDNAALYAELRGDKGGIGQEQYSSIQNTAAQNRLAVQQAQTKLATDTARAIEDLRAQGEFEKADAALEITQEYLSQLMSLEQWAAQYNLSVEQFNASLKQWKLEYNLELEQMGIDQERWEAEQDYKQQQFDYERYLNGISLAQSEKSQLAEVGWAMLELGLMPDEEYLDAMEIDQATAEKMMAMLGQQTDGEAFDPDEIYRAIYDTGLTADDRAAVKAYLMSIGIDETMAGAFANAYVDSEYGKIAWSGYGDWGEGWSKEDWDKIMETAEENLEDGRFKAFSKGNMHLIAQKATRAQWEELEKLLFNHGLDPYQLLGS